MNVANVKICENALFLANGMNKKLFPECLLLIKIHKMVAKFSCSDTNNCMIGKCSECSSTKLSSDNFNTTSPFDSDSTSPTVVMSLMLTEEMRT